MENIRAILSQVNLTDLIKLFNIQIASAIFLIFIIFRSLFARVLIKIFLLIGKSKKHTRENRLYKVLSNFFIFLGMYIAIRVLKPTNKVLGIVDSCFKITCIIFTTIGINTFITKDAKWFKRYINHSKNDVVNRFICKLIRGIIWVISIYIIIKEIGYDLTGLVASFGIGTVIISLAAQDTVKSLLSGAVILTDKPFDLGDYIEIGEHEGTVVDITFRSTRIRARNNTVITIPNSTITSECVVNWNRLSSRRFETVLNLSMDTTAEKIKRIVEKLKLVLKNNPDVLPETVQVNFDEIASYSSDIKIFLYVNKTDYIEFLNAKERICCEILELVELENIELAYPTQTLYVKNSDNTMSKLDMHQANLEEMIGEEDENLMMKLIAEEESKNKKKGDK